MTLPSFTCPVPWQHLEVGINNEAFLCCHIPTSTGNLLTSDPLECWNSPTALQIRQSILDGTYKYCRQSTCKFFNQTININDDSWWNLTLVVQPKIYAQAIAPPPLRVSLANEQTCNLKCISCRSKFINKTSPQVNVVWNRLENIIATSIKIKANGSGEFWINKNMRNFVYSQMIRNPKLQLEILTNASVLNADEYLKSEFAGRVDLIYISIDASTQETYKIVRGGDFKHVVNNLESLVNIHHKKNEPKYIVMSFVVSSVNFHEMFMFAEWGARLKIPVSFTRLQDWGHLDRHQFNDLNIASLHHPQHKSLIQIIGELKTKFPHAQLNEFVNLT